jgi:hypothetical protein
MNTTTEQIKVIDCGSGKEINGLPLFMRDDGDEILDKRLKELECFLKCLETYPLNTIILRDKTLIAHQIDGGNEWFRNQTTKNALLDFLLNPINHKVNGEIWSNGFLGSRWADTILNGKSVRLAFYTKKSDPEMFRSLDPTKNYAIIITEH